MTNFPTTFKLLFTSIFLQVVISWFPESLNYLALAPSSPNGLFVSLCQLITHQLAHGTWYHLIGNYLWGLPSLLFLEKKLGSKAMLEFYLVCGITSALLFIIMMGPFGSMVGSSGALFGIMAGACMAFGDTAEERLLASLFFALLLIPQFINATDPMPSNVAFWGHIGGGIGGLLIYPHFARKK